MRMHACSCDSRRVRACTAVTYNGMPAAGIVDSSYRWRPPRHGRGAEADPTAASGAAAVSDSGPSKQAVGDAAPCRTSSNSLARIAAI
jgi:hypothetical protein